MTYKCNPFFFSISHELTRRSPILVQISWPVSHLIEHELETQSQLIGNKSSSVLTFPKRSPFEKGWYGVSLNCSGTSHGPQPVGFSCRAGKTKWGLPGVAILFNTCVLMNHLRDLGVWSEISVIHYLARILPQPWKTLSWLTKWCYVIHEQYKSAVVNFQVSSITSLKLVSACQSLYMILYRSAGT